MPRLRVLLLSLLMLALPFQGFAAASMLACGLQQTAPAAMQHTAEMHEHAQHAAGAHDSAAQQHAHGDQQATAAQHAHPADASDLDHKCNVCGICHAAALLGMPMASDVPVLPQASPAMRFVAIASLAPRLPDKPPRA